MSAISALSDCTNLRMMGCEQIVEDALRQRPDRIIIHIHTRRDSRTENDSEVEDKNITLQANRALQLQLGTLLLLVDRVVIKALRKLTRALLRQQSHFDNIGATETTILVVVDDGACSDAAENGDQGRMSPSQH